MANFSSTIIDIIKFRKSSIHELSRKLQIDPSLLRRFISNTDKQIELINSLSKELNYNFYADLSAQEDILNLPDNSNIPDNPNPKNQMEDLK